MQEGLRLRDRSFWRLCFYHWWKFVMLSSVYIQRMMIRWTFRFHSCLSAHDCTITIWYFAFVNNFRYSRRLSGDSPSLVFQGDSKYPPQCSHFCFLQEPVLSPPHHRNSLINSIFCNAHSHLIEIKLIGMQWSWSRGPGRQAGSVQLLRRMAFRVENG